MNTVKKIGAKNCTYYFFDDMIFIKSLDPNKIKKNEKSHKNILTYKISYRKQIALSLYTLLSIK